MFNKKHTCRNVDRLRLEDVGKWYVSVTSLYRDQVRRRTRLCRSEEEAFAMAKEMVAKLHAVTEPALIEFLDGDFVSVVEGRDFEVRAITYRTVQHEFCPVAGCIAVQEVAYYPNATYLDRDQE